MIFSLSLSLSTILGNFCDINILTLNSLAFSPAIIIFSHSNPAIYSHGPIWNLVLWNLSASEARSQRWPQSPSLPSFQIANKSIFFHPYHHLPTTPSSNHYWISGLLLPPLNWSCWFCFVTHFYLSSSLQCPFFIKCKLEHCSYDSVQTLEHMHFN